MSHLKANIKRPVFQKNVKVDRELLELLLEFACKSFSYFSMSNHCQDNIKNILILEILKIKPPVALFKKKSRKVNQNLINAGVR